MSYDGRPPRPRPDRILSATPTEEYEGLLPRLEYVELRREGRLAKWLLRARGLAGSGRLGLTHEFVSFVPGARRSCGLIEHGRGHIRIVGAGGPGRTSCECYAVVRDEYDRLLSPEVHAG